MCLSQVPAAKHMSGECATEFFKTKMETLMMIDPSCKVEAAFFEAMYNTGAKDSLHGQMLAELPAQGRNDRLLDILLGLERIKHSTQCAFAADSARAGVNIVVEWVRNLALSSPPSFTAVGDDHHLQQLHGRLKYLFRHTETNGEGEDVEHFAEDAMKRRIAEIGLRMTSGDISDLGELKSLDAFSWLLTAEQRAKQATWVSELFKKKGMSKAPEPMQAKSSSSGSVGGICSASSRKAQAKKSASSSTMDLFKKRS